MASGVRGLGSARRRARWGLALFGAVVIALAGAAPALAAEATTTTVECTPAKVVIAQSTKCKATVSSTTTAIGKVAFSTNSSGAFSATQCPLAGTAGKASCEVEYTPSGAGTGKHRITAEYVPEEGTFEKSEGSTEVEVQARATTTAVSCEVASLVIFQPTKCTATVVDTSGGTPSAPTGKVAFTSSGVEGALGECELSGAGKEASCQLQYTPSAPPGKRKITAEYKGDAAHAVSSSSTPFEITVSVRSTSVAVSCEPASIVLGQSSAKCTATVEDKSPGAPPATFGKVAFSAAGSGSFSGTGECSTVGSGAKQSCSLEYLPTATGTHKITAKYLGSSSQATSEGSFELSVRQTVEVTLACGSSVRVGEASSCTVKVKDIGASPATPVGAVGFRSSAAGAFSPAAVCGLAKVSSSEAACQLSFTPQQAATHTITAEYEGDATHAGGSATAAILASAPPGTGTTTTTTTTTPPPPPAKVSAPKCRLEASELWQTGPTRKHKRTQIPGLLVPYTCDQNATVTIAAKVTTPASGKGKKRKKAKTYSLPLVSAFALGGKPATAVKLVLPGPAANGLTGGGLRELVVITFTVKNENGLGAATLNLTLLPRRVK